MAWNKTKYGSKKVVVDGIVFDSKKEAKRYQELSLLEKAGAIQNLQRQVRYELIPAQYKPVFDFKKNIWKDKCIERKCEYVADFVYFMDGCQVVEDTKGYRTKDYIIKRKLMLYVHGIRIREV